MINGWADTPLWVVDNPSSFQHNLARSRSTELFKLVRNTNWVETRFLEELSKYGLEDDEDAKPLSFQSYDRVNHHGL